MKWLFGSTVQKIAVILLAICLLCPSLIAQASSMDAASVRAAPLSTDRSPLNGMVRVYLSSLGNPSHLDLTVQGNYSLSHNGEFLSNGQKLSVDFSHSTGKITLSYNGQTLNMGKQFSLRRHSASGSNGILINQSRENQNPYPGDLSFQAVSGSNGYTLYVIAHVYIENYLYGVVPYEMGNSNHIEALKAQAVAARTYAVRMMKSRASGLYDVKDTTADQSYRGTPSGNANCKAAVDATKGIVLMYGSDYITTYYSASNGGQTEKARTGASYAYMKVKDDPFDYANTSSTVKSKTIYADLSSTSNNAQLMNLLRTKAISRLNQTGYSANSSNTLLKTLQSVTPHTPMYASPSRVYTKMDFTFTVSTQNAMGQTVTVPQTVTCDIFDELESMLSMGIQSQDNELWTVSKKNGYFSLQARRYGHGMGMSQRGAMQMARLGYTYDEILGFYYDGCKRMQHSFTNTILSASSSNQEVTVETPVEMEQENDSICKGTVMLAGNGAFLAVRNAASSDAKVIGTAGNGALVRVLSQSNDWCLIRYGEITGYVPAPSLQISGTPENAEDSVTEIAGFSVVTANDFVNLRASGSMNAQVLGTAPSGTVLTVLSKSGSWAKVQYHALVAYANTNYISSISSSYPSGDLSNGTQTATVVTSDGTSTVNLRKSPSMQADLVNRLSDGTVVTVVSDDGSWSYVVCSEGEGYVLSEFLKPSEEILPPSLDEPETEEDDNKEEDSQLTAVIATEYGSLNLRAQAHAGSRILTTIPKGMTVRVMLRDEPWSGVEYNGYSGYVMSRYLAFEDDAQQPESDEMASKAMVVTPSGTLNLRGLPRTGSEILTRIPPGSILEVYQKGTDWCQVCWQGWSGYVMTQFLQFLPDEPEQDSSEQETPDVPENAPEEPAEPETPEEDEPEQELEEDQSPESEEAEPPAEENPGSENVLTATVRTESGSLNLRSSPTRYAQVITTVPQNAMVVIAQRNDDWCFVCYQGVYGYVMTRYLAFEGEENQPDTDDVPDLLKAWVQTASGSLNLRISPVSGARIVTTIPRGAEVSVVSYGEIWCSVAYGPYAGFAMTEFLRFDQSADGNESSTESNTGTYDEASAVTAWVNTVSGSLNLRESASKNAKVIAEIPRNVQVLLLEEGSEWSFVRYQSVYGYVTTSYLSTVQPLEETDTDTETEKNESAENVETPYMDPTLKEPSGMKFATLLEETTLWSACEERGREIATLEADMQVQILMLGDEWCQIGYEAYQGYCPKEKLSVIE